MGFFAALAGFLAVGFFAAFFVGAVFAGFFAALTLAQRFRCASAIAFRAFALSFRREAGFSVGGAALLMLESSTRAFWSLSSSASIAAMIEFVSIRISLSQKSYCKLSGISEPVDPPAASKSLGRKSPHTLRKQRRMDPAGDKRAYLLCFIASFN